MCRPHGGLLPSPHLQPLESAITPQLKIAFVLQMAMQCVQCLSRFLHLGLSLQLRPKGIWYLWLAVLCIALLAVYHLLIFACCKWLLILTPNSLHVLRFISSRGSVP